MTDDLKHYKAPLGAFQLLTPAVAELIIICGIAGVIVFGVLPDVFAWMQGRTPVAERCK